MSRLVLIVEDSEQSAVTLEIALLAIPDLTVRRFGNARDALQFLDGGESLRVSAVVTDLSMPNMDGFELIRRIRGDQRHARLPILVISADTDPRTPERITKLGADAFFSKPFSPASVRTKLEQLVNACANPSQS